MSSHRRRHTPANVIQVAASTGLTTANTALAMFALTYGLPGPAACAIFAILASLYALLLTIDDMEEAATMPDNGYQAIARQLRWEIDEQVLPPGTKLAKYKELAARFGCTQTTISRAIKVLINDGKVHTRRGQGIYVVGAGGDKGTRTDTATARVEAHLRKQAITGLPLAGSQILQQVYRVSPSTVNRVHRKLVSEGLIRKDGHGKYVTTR